MFGYYCCCIPTPLLLCLAPIAAAFCFCYCCVLLRYLRAEAEYIAAAATSNQAIWLRRILEDIGEKQEEPTTIYCDNKSAIAITKNSVQHSRTKHIDIKYHSLREATTRGEIELKLGLAKLGCTYILGYAAVPRTSLENTFGLLTIGLSQALGLFLCWTWHHGPFYNARPDYSTWANYRIMGLSTRNNSPQPILRFVHCSDWARLKLPFAFRCRFAAVGKNDGRGPPPLDSPLHCESNETLPTNFHQVSEDIRNFKVFAIVGVAPPFPPSPGARSPSDNHRCAGLTVVNKTTLGHLYRKDALFAIANNIGTPLQIADSTLNQSNLAKALAAERYKLKGKAVAQDVYIVLDKMPEKTEVGECSNAVDHHREECWHPTENENETDRPMTIKENALNTGEKAVELYDNESREYIIGDFEEGKEVDQR
ncbi:Retrovirus-related Pol polyprotein from transposon TNT 1-94 [Sesamum angolense]|uniref:Retrovirus-related Pol polyprotein from transposon TNT 1-94 n=1 Tax=Sesamum angolense TaxID=2727404 RepID=A0AAE1W2T8_9LAMI|nr:Retrovirus-related Pol polyprotein from transposon TNT 1-94 [Sesamum angolense]